MYAIRSYYEFLLKDSPCYIGIYKGEARLKEKVDALVAEALADGTLDKLSLTWLKAPLPANLGK